MSEWRFYALSASSGREHIYSRIQSGDADYVHFIYPYIDTAGHTKALTTQLCPLKESK